MTRELLEARFHLHYQGDADAKKKTEDTLKKLRPELDRYSANSHDNGLELERLFLEEKLKNYILYVTCRAKEDPHKAAQSGLDASNSRLETGSTVIQKRHFHCVSYLLDWTENCLVVPASGLKIRNVASARSRCLS